MRRASCFLSVWAFFMGIFCLACLAGCAAVDDGGGQADEAEREDVYVHTVEWPGETLPMIAQWYTGNKDNWKILAKTNPNIASGHLAVDDRVLIPFGLVKNNKGMPKEFIATFNAKNSSGQKKPSPKTKQTPENKEEFQLYGPK